MKKNSIELLVEYSSGTVMITLLKSFSAIKRAAEVIAQSEQTLARLALRNVEEQSAFASLISYFRQRDWKISECNHPPL